MQVQLSGGILRVRDLYRIAWEIFSANGQHVLLLLLFLIIPGSLLDYALYNAFNVDPDVLADTPYDMLASAGSYIFYQLATIYLTLLTAAHFGRAPDGISSESMNDGSEGLRPSTLFSASLRYYLVVFAAVIVMTILVILGLVLLIVPGIIAIILLAFAEEIIVLEGAGPLRGLVLSRELVRGHFWKVFEIALVFILPWMLLQFILPEFFVPATGRFVSTLVTGFGGLFITIGWTVFYLNAREVWRTQPSEEADDAPMGEKPLTPGVHL